MATQIVKKWMRQSTQITRNAPFPTLAKCEWEFILEKCAREINEIPIAKGQEYALLTPGALIYPHEMESLSIPEANSKMHAVNDMLTRMRLIHEEMRNVRLQIMRKQAFDVEDAKSKGRGKRKLIPAVGDVVMVNPKEKWDKGAFNYYVSKLEGGGGFT